MYLRNFRDCKKIKKKGRNRNNWLHKKRGKFSQELFKKNTYIKSRQYELRYKSIDVFN